MKKGENLDSNKKTTNLFVVSFLIAITLIIIFIFFSYYSNSQKIFIKGPADKKINGGLPSLSGKKSQDNPQNNIIDSSSVANTPEGTYCRNKTDCYGCMTCDMNSNTCIKLNAEIKIGYCESEVYEGTKSEGDFICLSGMCAYVDCSKNCTGKVCGPDGCGGECGSCPDGESCDSDYRCSPSQSGDHAREGESSRVHSINDQEKKAEEEKSGLNQTKCSNCPENESYIDGHGINISLCCKSDEICYYNKEKKYPPFCIADKSKIKKDWEYCTGTEDFQEFSRWCYSKLTYCSKDDRSRPKCIPKGELSISNPSETYTTSIYMIRDKDSFTFDGKAYVIKPHMNFNKKINVYINNSDDTLETYKYSNKLDVLGECNATLIYNTSSFVGPEGSVLSIKDEIVLNVPKEALDNRVLMTIEVYDLSSCIVNNVDDESYKIIDDIVPGNISSNPSDNSDEIPLAQKISVIFIIAVVVIIMIVIFLIVCSKKYGCIFFKKKQNKISK